MPRILAGLALATLIATPASQTDTLKDVLSIAPTLTTTTLLRGGAGAFGAKRGRAKHSGVDIVANREQQQLAIELA